MKVVWLLTALVCLCVLGNRDLRGGPVLVIDTSRPDWGNVAYTSMELMRLFMYFHTIPK